MERKPNTTLEQVTDELAAELVEADWTIVADEQQLGAHEAAKFLLRFCVIHADRLGELCVREGKAVELFSGALYGGVAESDYKAAKQLVLGRGGAIRHGLERTG
jgi:hypothetical protein